MNNHGNLMSRTVWLRVLAAGGVVIAAIAIERLILHADFFRTDADKIAMIVLVAMFIGGMIAIPLGMRDAIAGGIVLGVAFTLSHYYFLPGDMAGRVIDDTNAFETRTKILFLAVWTAIMTASMLIGALLVKRFRRRRAE